MTRFRVRPKPPGARELHAVYPERAKWIRGTRQWLIGAELRSVQRRDVVPLVNTLAEKARACVQYDRRCDAIAHQRTRSRG